MAEVSKVSIDAGECISCEACVDACADVFEMGKDAAVVNPSTSPFSARRMMVPAPRKPMPLMVMAAMRPGSSRSTLSAVCS